VPDGPAPIYDDFSDGPNGWQSKWSALSIANNLPENAPMITEPGYDVNTLDQIPSSLTTESITAERAGIMSKNRVSRFASVVSARLISALSATNEPTGGLPNAILQIRGNANDDDPTQSGFSNWIELDLEGYSSVNGETRVRYRIFGNGPNIGNSAIPVPVQRLGDLTATNGLELTVSRVGSFYDFYINNIHIFSHDIPITNMVDHKVFLYSFQIASPLTWDWVRMSSAVIAPAPLARASRALRIAGGLEAAPAGADFTALNPATSGDSATRIDILDAVTLARQGL